MKYRNASELLPDDLLKELQKYVSGEVLYIPAEGKRKQWGDGSGARAYYQERNELIRYRYFSLRVSIETLSDEFGLAVETIRKILYRA